MSDANGRISMKYDHLVDKNKREAYIKLVETIEQNLPNGFKKVEEYGGIGYVVPHSLYPKGYHVTPDKPLPFLGLIAQKQHIGLYHMGIYADTELLQWFQQEYARQVPTKLNMGKSCIRLTNTKHIPYKLIGDLLQKITPQQWIELYERQLVKK